LAPAFPDSDQPEDPRLRELETIADADDDEMYESGYPTGCYSRAKEALHDAIALAAQLGRRRDAERLEEHLHNVKEVFRHRFT
jgi:hypothetical protein